MLIPFGLKDGKYYDVSEVERGRACGCICPSCNHVLGDYHFWISFSAHKHLFASHFV